MTFAARRGVSLPAALADPGPSLRAGVRVVDVRCDDGRALIELARAFPASTFHGFGSDPDAVASARRAAALAGVSDRVTFEVASGGGVEAAGYDLIVDAERVSGRSRSIRYTRWRRPL
jgi:cyclopropane fatty-acyl-phospholipid synthase-like methyltransferase